MAYLIRFRQRGREIGTVFLLVPLLVLTFYFNWINRFPKGICYFLPAFPLAMVFTGSLFSTWRQWTRVQKGAAVAALVWVAASTLSYFPHFIPYFNELVPDRREAYHILAHSNLDWGQSEWYLSDYVEKHPWTIVEPGQPTSGRIVVGANKLLGIIGDPSTYAWLRDNFDPIDTVAYSYLVFDVTPGDIERLHK